MSADKLGTGQKKRSLLARVFGPLPPAPAAARFGLLVGILAIGLSFLVPNRYRATAAFYLDTRQPGGGSSSADLASIASQVGLGAPTGSVSPYLVVELANSDTVMVDVVRTPLPADVFRRTKPARTLEEHYEVTEKTPEANFRRTIQELHDRVGSNVGNRSGLISIGVWDHDPGLAAWLAGQILDRMRHYLSVARASRARAERVFIESRERAVRDSLRDAEAELAAFLSSNRITTQSPELQIREAQLRRKVDIATTLYSAVQRDLERARAEEVRDTPVMTVVATPFVPIRKSWPKRSMIGIMAFALAFGLHITRRQWEPAVRSVMTGLRPSGEIG
jgi:uncharacterized protein involved in exopolysaccharide biosynthesis